MQTSDIFPVRNECGTESDVCNFSLLKTFYYSIQYYLARRIFQTPQALGVLQNALDTSLRQFEKMRLHIRLLRA